MSEEFSSNVETAPGRSLELSRPLAVLDVHSTGLDPTNARIVKLAVFRVDPDGTEHVKSVVMLLVHMTA